MRKLSIKKIFLIAGGVLITYFFLLSILIDVESHNDQGTIRNYFDAVWYSLVTATTVGYGDYYPITVYGRMIGYIFIFISILIYGVLIGQIASFMTSVNENKKLGYNGTRFENHAIIVGWDGFARGVLDQLVSAGKKVALITDDRNTSENVYESYDKKYVYCLYTDLNNIEVLRKANIEKSSIVFVNLKNDTDKLVYINNLKGKFKNLQFLITLENANLKQTFKNVGVTHIISKEEIYSKLLASYIFEPDVALYSEDIMSYAKANDDHDIKQFKVLSDNPYSGKSYEDAFYDLKKSFNCILIGISKEKNGRRTLLKNPVDEVKIEVGDYLIMIMNRKALDKVGKVFKIDEGYSRF